MAGKFGVQGPDEVARALNQLHEAGLLVVRGHRPAAALRRLLQQFIDGRLEPRDRAEVYRPLLKSRRAQLRLIGEYNQRFWGGRWSDKELENARWLTGSDDVDSARRLDCWPTLHVEFDSPAETIAMWALVLEGTQPGFRFDHEALEAGGCPGA